MRFQFKDLDPSIYQALATVQAYVRESPWLSDREKEMIKLRASQINGCAFCINMHAREALKAGETEQRLNLLSAWREAPQFTAVEKILLAMTEEVTLQGLSEATYQKALDSFGAERTVAALMTIIAINNWNRTVLSGHMPITD